MVADTVVAAVVLAHAYLVAVRAEETSSTDALAIAADTVARAGVDTSIEFSRVDDKDSDGAVSTCIAHSTGTDPLLANPVGRAAVGAERMLKAVYTTPSSSTVTLKNARALVAANTVVCAVIHTLSQLTTRRDDFVASFAGITKGTLASAMDTQTPSIAVSETRCLQLTALTGPSTGTHTFSALTDSSLRAFVVTAARRFHECRSIGARWTTKSVGAFAQAIGTDTVAAADDAAAVSRAGDVLGAIATGVVLDALALAGNTDSVTGAIERAWRVTVD